MKHNKKGRTTKPRLYEAMKNQTIVKDLAYQTLLDVVEAGHRNSRQKAHKANTQKVIHCLTN